MFRIDLNCFPFDGWDKIARENLLPSVSTGTTTGGNIPAKIITERAGRDTWSCGLKAGLQARNPQFPTAAPNPHRLRITKEPRGLTLHKNSWFWEARARNIPESFAEGGQQVASWAEQMVGK